MSITQPELLIKNNDLNSIISPQKTISEAVNALSIRLPFSKKICNLIVKEFIQNNPDITLIDDATEINMETELMIDAMSGDEVDELQDVLNSANNNQLIIQLQREKEIAESKVRSKDKIIASATEKIERLEKELRYIKEEEEREVIQMGTIPKKRATILLEERVQHKLESGLISDKTEEEDQDDIDEKEAKDLRQLLNESDSIEDATRIIKSRGVLVHQYSNKEKRDIYTLNMNNRYNVVNRLAKEEHRIQFMEYLAYSLVDKKQKHNKVEKVLLNNMWLDDKLFVPFMNIILTNVDHFYVSELSINCSKIYINGAKKISELIALNLPCLKCISWQQNKRDIPTKVINDDLLNALEKNTNITKLSLFKLNIQQYRDKKDRLLKRNNDIARQIRNDMRKKKIIVTQ